MDTLIDIVQRFPAMILALNKQGEILICNQWFQEKSGYSAKELISNPDSLKRIFGEDPDYGKLEKVIKRSGKNFTENFPSMKCKCADGSFKFVQVVLRYRQEQPLAPGIHVWIIGFDRTEERLLKNELEESSLRFEMISKATNDAVWDWDVLKNTLWWGEGISKLFGYPKAGRQTEFEWWVERIHEEDREKVVRSLLNAAANGEQSWSSEYRFLRTDGTYAFVLDKGTSLFDKNLKVYRMIGGMIDISDKYIYEHSLMIKNQQLAEYAFFNSHKVRAPLSRLLAIVDMMKHLPSDNPDLNRLLKSIHESALELDREIKDVNKLISTDIRVRTERED